MKNYTEPIDYKRPTPEYNSGEVLSVPGQALSVKQLYQRMKAGMPLGGRQVQYDDSQDFDDNPIQNSTDVDYVDIIEHNQYIENKKRHKKYNDEKQKIDADEEAMKEAEKKVTMTTTKEEEKEP